MTVIQSFISIHTEDIWREIYTPNLRIFGATESLKVALPSGTYSESLGL